MNKTVYWRSAAVVCLTFRYQPFLWRFLGDLNGLFVVLLVQVVVFGEWFTKQLPGANQRRGEAQDTKSSLQKKNDKKRFPKRHTRQHRHTLYDEEGDEGGVGREDEESGQGPGAIRSPLMGESL